MDRLVGLTNKRQHATSVGHCFKLPVHGALLLSLSHALVDLGIGAHIVSGADLSKGGHPQRKHQRWRMSSLARGVDGTVDFR
jgi:hypothetical protein